MRRRLVWILAAFLVAALAGISYLTRPLGAEGSVLVSRAAPSARPILQLVDSADSPAAWVVRHGIRTGLWITGKSVLPGWYHIKPDASALDIIRMIVGGGREPLVKVTIPEGFSIGEIAFRLWKRAEVDSAAFLAWCRSDTVCRTYAVEATSMEGFLMPDTYFVIRGDDPSYVGHMMAQQARRLWNQLAGDSLQGGWQQRQRIVTLASIVQLEAGRIDEMPRIAGVYVNRLRIGMRLQADPTVQYLTGKDRITGSELRDASNPYNTYVHAGLPPGPICNPGKAAFTATMNPESHDWIFFVARGDGTMRHRFAVTLAEHNQNVRLYREAIGRAPSN
ncbi:MAG: endolytic transglycosylase MltG [Candidatus Kapabacteria bacterium]|nr:endolytic transglycosylase MltG [Candidatus Kapabacteria bacterium]